MMKELIQAKKSYNNLLTSALQLNEMYKRKVKENEEYKERIDKVIEYIEKTDTFQLIHSVDSWGEKLRDKTKKDLLEILRGEKE